MVFPQGSRIEIFEGIPRGISEENVVKIAEGISGRVSQKSQEEILMEICKVCVLIFPFKVY